MLKPLSKNQTYQLSAVAYLQCRRGSALVETMLSLPVLMLIIFGVLLTTYLSFEKIWLERATREAAFCMANTLNNQANKAVFCKKRLQQTLQLALPFGHIQSMTMIELDRHITVKVSLVVGPPRVSDYEFIEKTRTLKSHTKLQKISLGAVRGL